MNAFQRPLALLLLAALTVAGCKVRFGRPDRETDADTAHTTVTAAPPVTMPPVPVITAQDTPTLPAVVPDQVETDVTADTGVIRATPADLAELGATLAIPVQGITRSMLRDTYTESRGTRLHDAIDILAARGTPVLSATNGRLLRLFNSKPGGLMVYATDASERFILLYGHLDGYAPGVTDGMKLVRGQVIGYVGTTGNAPPNTPHLHFGILRGRPTVSWSKGEAVNPYPLLMQSK